MASGTNPKNGERGFSLVLVMWGMALLSVVATALIDETRHAARLSVSRVAEVQAGMLAEAGLERALVAIDERPTERSWPEDGTPVEWSFGGGRMTISIADEAGKIDALNSPEALLVAALASAGIDQQKQEAVAYQIRLIHTQALFGEGGASEVTSLEQLPALTGLTPEEIERLRPLMTVRTRIPGFDPQVATRATLAIVPGLDSHTIDDYLAVRASTRTRADAERRPTSPAIAFTTQSPRTIFAVRVEACSADGHMAIRDAIVRRAAPGKYVRLEMRQPYVPTLMPGGCAPIAVASRQN